MSSAPAFPLAHHPLRQSKQATPAAAVTDHHRYHSSSWSDHPQQQQLLLTKHPSYPLHLAQHSPSLVPLQSPTCRSHQHNVGHSHYNPPFPHPTDPSGCSSQAHNLHQRFLPLLPSISPRVPTTVTRQPSVTYHPTAPPPEQPGKSKGPIPFCDHPNRAPSHTTTGLASPLPPLLSLERAPAAFCSRIQRDTTLTRIQSPLGTRRRRHCISNRDHSLLQLASFSISRSVCIAFRPLLH